MKINQNKGLQFSPLAIAIVAAVASLPVQAQSEDPKELERIEVTGSRIKRAAIEGQAPVFTLTREDIAQTGLTSVGDVLQQLTTGGKALNTKFNSSGNFGYPPDGGGIGAGSAQVDLRNLESKRVLVLVDGLRWVNESSASGVGSATDLNTIPLAIVERIEVLEDGASAIYGSDAIAGVINIITRREFTGAEINTYYGEYDEGDGETTKADVTIGGSGERFSAVLSASYVEQKTVFSKDRAQAREPVPGTGVTRGSSATPQGRFIFTDPRTGTDLDITLNPGTGTPVYNPANPTSGNSTYNPFDITDRFNFSPFNLVLTPNERKSLFAQARYDVTDNVTWYVKALYNQRESVNQAAPEPIFLGSDAGTGGLADTVSISRLNPFNPFGIDLVSGDNFFLLARRPLEGGPRIYTQSVDTYYFATGLQGGFSWGDRAFSWDVNFLDTESSADQVARNTYNVRAIQLALGDPAVCRATPGCVPLNLFGGQGANGQGTITREMLRWIQPITKDTSENALQLFSANLTGDILELPAGPLSFATGYEHREYDGSFTPDALKISGESNDVLAQATSGEYDVNEYFVEFNVPLLSGLPIVEQLDLSVAGRYSDYSTFGGETTGKAGIRWQWSEEFLLRATVAEGFRAPSIGELFGSATRFDAVLNDPCSNNVTANCRALGVPTGYEQINPQISVTTGGNIDLEPETADSTSAGFVYSPAWAEGLLGTQKFDLEFTWYKHEVDGAIRAIDAQDQLNRCVASGNPNSLFCQGITRTPTGQINQFANRLVNIGQIETDGYDVKLNWTGPDTDWGTFDVSWENTFVNDYEAIALGAVQPQQEGREVNDGAIPEWQSNLTLGWKLGNWSAGWTVRHIDSVTEACSDFRDGTSLSLTALGLCSEPNTADNSLSENRLGATTYHDLQVGWRNPFGVEGLGLTAGVNNIGDKDPPICVSCSLNGYDAGTYEIPGRFYYVQANYRF
jgi:iron complex outermembrane receptor protein